jgi:carbonic anhydrase
MRSIDFTFRFNPDLEDARGLPRDAAEAQAVLEEGNRVFARWTENCQREGAKQEEKAYIVHCGPQDLGLTTPEGKVSKQAPFAVLLGCSDARVPAEMIFGQVRNNLFVVRLAGNVLSSEGLGSVSYAVHHLHESLRIIVVLGHTGCGAVSAAVDTYLNPWAYLATVPSPSLRSIVDRIFAPVRKAASVLENIWGPSAATQPFYRQALVETAVFVNAAQAAYNLRQERTALGGRPEIRVIYGVFDLLTHLVWSIPEISEQPAAAERRMAEAPANLKDFEELALRMGLRVTRKMTPGRKSWPRLQAPE